MLEDYAASQVKTSHRRGPLSGGETPVGSYCLTNGRAGPAEADPLGEIVDLQHPAGLGRARSAQVAEEEDRSLPRGERPERMVEPSEHFLLQQEHTPG